MLAALVKVVRSIVPDSVAWVEWVLRCRCQSAASGLRAFIGTFPGRGVIFFSTIFRPAPRSPRRGRPGAAPGGQYGPDMADAPAVDLVPIPAGVRTFGHERRV